MKIGIMNVTKRILFIISLIVGNIAIGTIVFYYYDKNFMFQSIAVFTSLTTAINAIMNKPEKKAEPLLRIRSRLRSFSMASASLDVIIDNVGTSIAKGIRGTCTIIPVVSTPLENNGTFSIDLLTPTDPPYIYLAIPKIVMDAALLNGKLVVEVEYSDLDDKRKPLTKKEIPFKNLQRELATQMYRRSR